MYVNVEDAIFWLSPTVESCNWIRIDFISVSISNDTTETGRTQRKKNLLVRAVQDDHITIVDALLSSGFDPDARDKEKDSALGRAIKYGREKCVDGVIDEEAAEMLRTRGARGLEAPTRPAEIRMAENGASKFGFNGHLAGMSYLHIWGLETSDRRRFSSCNSAGVFLCAVEEI